MDPTRFSLAALFLVVLLSCSSCLVSGAEDTSCLQRLVSCVPYVDERTGTPPPQCCAPLAEVIQEQKKCLCALFNNQEFLTSFHVTQQTVLELPRRCGIPVADNVCEAFLGGAPAPSTPPSGGSPNVPSKPPGSGAKSSGVTLALTMTSLLLWLSC